ncbi:RidA family protein [Isoptericola sp. NPDC057191]|uniref:RidA family protein n=1 Tax=Isoptericola sp. NPDC057191 TaxID=3346041 RepID=UPI00363C1DFD
MSVAGEMLDVSTRTSTKGRTMSTPTPVNPPSLHQNPAFAQGMVLPPGRTLYVGGQNGTGPDGALVEGGLGPQTEKALRNVLAVLAEAGTDAEHVAKLTIYLDPSVDANEAYAASGRVWRSRTAVTVLAVAPARPGALVEVEAVATVPEA